MTRLYSPSEITAAEAATLNKGRREQAAGIAAIILPCVIVACPALARDGTTPLTPYAGLAILLSVIVGALVCFAFSVVRQWLRNEPCPHQDITGEAEAQSIRRTEFGR